MIGDYHYKCKKVDEVKSRFGISQIEGIVDESKNFISSIELLKIPSEGIILLENPYTQPKFRTPKENYLKEIIRHLSKEFKEDEKYESYIELIESESLKDKGWQRIYHENGWKNFSSSHPYSYWVAKGMNLEDREQIRRARKVIKDLFKLPR